ncbi:MAG TPA: repressor LexA [Marinobacter sp.]|uniref:LexA repressor n=1 Tax=marine sediment metagenome TaxID=412755 RepID=A0A0F9P3N3_9ZZZZ|nr:transcriptional repressor LexA [Methylophaga thalassica]WVI83829.1 transcriptional repressor LexA [Methylophaga thalassica]HDZ39216.1 repressor LexA [Marinobacter sp.]|tara:strand:- start:535 stop:1134 length:600 start_codon:yes stop_codon:yes gene_type:complete
MLTQRESDTLEFIRKYIKEEGKAPLVSEIARNLGITSHGTAHRYIKSLINAGYLEQLPLRTRGLKLAETQDPDSLSLPVMGKIAAGRLIEAVQDESEINLGDMFLGTSRYVLKITGESMIGKGIMPGDYVVVETARAAKDGDIVVALVDNNEATLKTLLINDDETLTLMPANESYDPITLSARRLDIQGVIVGQLRTYP